MKKFYFTFMLFLYLVSSFLSAQEREPSTGFSEDFNDELTADELEMWQPDQTVSTRNPDVLRFTVTQEENALRVEMIQDEFSNGQMYDFGFLWDISAYPMCAALLKVEEGAMHGDNEVTSVEFKCSPWTFLPDSSIRQHSEIPIVVAADDQWYEVLWDWSNDDADQTIHPNIYTDIHGILLETVKWPDPYEAVFWIDDFRLGDAVAAASVDPAFQPSLMVIGYSLAQNYPNPFNNETIINYQLSIPCQVELSIYNLQGRKVATLISGRQQAGYHHVTWHAEGLAGGTYFYRLTAGRTILIKKMSLVK
jgi:hypothetical protein